MNFFKSSKYKLSGGNVKTKAVNQTKQKEHFQKIDAAPIYDIDKNSTKKKAPPTPSDVKLNSNEMAACFRISNQTSLPWKLKDGESEGIFPSEVPPKDSKLVRIGLGQLAAQATYEVVVKSNSREFELKIARDGELYQLLVDWKNLTDLEGIQFKPEPASCNLPIELSSEEALVELVCDE